MPEQKVQGVDFVVHYQDNTWNNNGGADYHIPVTPASPGGIENAGEARFSLFPNPAHDFVTLRRRSMFVNEADVILKSSTGQALRFWKMNTETLFLNTVDLPDGLYFVQLVHKDGAVETHRLIIVHN